MNGSLPVRDAVMRGRARAPAHSPSSPSRQRIARRRRQAPSSSLDCAPLAAPGRRPPYTPHNAQGGGSSARDDARRRARRSLRG